MICQRVNVMETMDASRGGNSHDFVGNFTAENGSEQSVHFLASTISFQGLPLNHLATLIFPSQDSCSTGRPTRYGAMSPQSMSRFQPARGTHVEAVATIGSPGPSTKRIVEYRAPPATRVTPSARLARAGLTGPTWLQALARQLLTSSLLVCANSVAGGGP